MEYLSLKYGCRSECSVPGCKASGECKRKKTKLFFDSYLKSAVAAEAITKAISKNKSQYHPRVVQLAYDISVRLSNPETILITKSLTVPFSLKAFKNIVVDRLDPVQMVYEWIEGAIENDYSRYSNFTKLMFLPTPSKKEVLMVEVLHTVVMLIMEDIIANGKSTEDFNADDLITWVIVNRNNRN